jgi:hypothetical protein
MGSCIEKTEGSGFFLEVERNFATVTSSLIIMFNRGRKGRAADPFRKNVVVEEEGAYQTGQQYFYLHEGSRESVCSPNTETSCFP